MCVGKLVSHSVGNLFSLCGLVTLSLLQVSHVLNWIKNIMAGDDLNLENCGVTYVN